MILAKRKENKIIKYILDSISPNIRELDKTILKDNIIEILRLDISETIKKREILNEIVWLLHKYDSNTDANIKETEKILNKII